MKKIEKGNTHLEHIWHQVPPNYYQNGVKKNILQRMWHTGKLKTIADMIARYAKNPQTILDMGCASGWFLSELSKKFKKAKCLGIDVYRDAIQYGKKKYKKISFRCEDIHEISAKNNSFDIVICAEVLEHVVDPLKVLKEIKRVVKKDGIAVIEMDTGNFLFQAIWYWWTHMRHGVWEDAHIQVFNAEKLEKLIVQSGFTIVKKKTFNFSMAIAFVVRK